jgi:hypothetical protein
MRHSWGAIGTGSLLGLALLLVLLQLLVVLQAATPHATALAPAPGEQRQPPTPPTSPPREQERKVVPRQFRGLIPEPGPRPPRRAVA